MKAINLTVLFMFLALTVFSACDQEEAISDLNEVEFSSDVLNSSEIATVDAQIQSLECSSDPATLENADADGLLLMREEEKMAKDVYTVFYHNYKLPVFLNISKSETRHTEAVLRLINYFELEDPALSEDGAFSNPDIQELYYTLVDMGTDVISALQTGAYIEEYDIADLKKLLETTTNSDIQKVYTNLLEGSKSHLKAFTRVLASRKVTYEPQILSVEEYDAIISAK